MVKGYQEFLLYDWKEHPNFVTANPQMTFSLSGDKKYVTNINRVNIQYPWMVNGRKKESFDRFIRNGLNLIKPGVSDFDKMVVLQRYVVNWFKYDINMLEVDINILVDIHAGVCSSVSTAFSILLNIAGIPSLSVITGQNPGNVLHQISYVYLKAPGKNEKYWYASDPTYATSTSGIQTDYQYAYTKDAASRYEIIFPVGADYDSPLNGQQFHYNQFNYLPWDVKNSKQWLGKIFNGKNQFSVFGKDNMYAYLWNDYADKNLLYDQRSSFEFYEGWYYGLRSTLSKGTREWKKSFFKTRFNQDKLIEVPLSEFLDGDQDMTRLIMSYVPKEELRYPLLTSFRDSFIFLKDNGTYKKSLYVYNKKIKKGQVIELKNIETGTKIVNYYTQDEKLFIQLSNNNWITYNFTPEEHQLIFESNLNWTDLVNQLLTTKTKLSTFTIGQNAHQIDLNDKIKFNNMSMKMLKQYISDSNLIG